MLFNFINMLFYAKIGPAELMSAVLTFKMYIFPSRAVVFALNNFNELKVFFPTFQIGTANCADALIFFIVFYFMIIDPFFKEFYKQNSIKKIFNNFFAHVVKIWVRPKYETKKGAGQTDDCPKVLYVYNHPNNLLHLLLKFINEISKKWLLGSFHKFSSVNIGGLYKNYNSFLLITNGAKLCFIK
jgi:hypothetical protein